MKKERRTILIIAFLGFLITAVLYAYLEHTHYATLAPALRLVAVVLCPASLLLVLFIDADPGSGGIAILWFFIGLVNCAIYAALAAGFRRLRRRADRPSAE